MGEQVPADRLRIVVFTDMPLVAAFYPSVLGELGHEFVGIVTSRRRYPGIGEIVNVAPLTTDIVVSEHPNRWAAIVGSMRPDVIISSSFPWRIPQAVLDAPRYGAFNLHPSLLPKYRGTATPFWTLLNGERATGLTAHRMVADFDAGPILSQVEIEIAEDDDVNAVMRAIIMRGPEVIVTAIQRLVAGDPGDPQDESQATYFGELPESERQVTWSSPARRIHNQVRAFAGLLSPPGAYATIDGAPVRLLKSRTVPADGMTAAEPGTVIARDDAGLTIQCGDGPIRVLQFEPA